MGVSESSVKRWVDRGAIPSRKTAGGHRRLPAAGVVRFLREQGYSPARPELLGLPRALASAVGLNHSRTVLRLTKALEAGDEPAVRTAILAPFLAGTPLAEIFDQLVAPAFHHIGHDWESGALQVYREHRAVEITTRLFHELRVLLPDPAHDAPRAVGATLEGDPYTLPLLMAELVLLEKGWRAEALGPSHPTSTLQAVLADLAPRLLWLNLSYVPDRQRLVCQYAELFDDAQARGVAVLLGGQALDADLRAHLRCTGLCDSMVDLIRLSATLAN